MCVFVQRIPESLQIWSSETISRRRTIWKISSYSQPPLRSWQSPRKKTSKKRFATSSLITARRLDHSVSKIDSITLQFYQENDNEDEDYLQNVAPKKANWDLKRDVEAKLAKLERRTQRAIIEARWRWRWRRYFFIDLSICFFLKKEKGQHTQVIQTSVVLSCNSWWLKRKSKGS